MKIKDILAKLGINLEQEVDDTNSPSLDLIDNVEKNLNDEDKSKQVDTQIPEVKEEPKQEEKKKMAINFKFDPNTGLFTGLNNVEDEELRAILKQANTAVKEKENKAKVETAIKTKLDSLKLIDGITSDVVRKLLDTSNIRVQDDEVVGVNEAFDSLVKSQSGLFKVNKETKQEPSPMLEGFSKPMDKTSPFSENDVVTLAYGAE